MSEKTYEDRANLLREAQAAVKVAEAKVATAELELSFTRMTAPIAGRISRCQHQPGQLGHRRARRATRPAHHHRQPGSDPHLLRRQREQLHQVQASGGARRDQECGPPGASVEMALPDETSFVHKGRLDFIDNRLDAGTATLRVRAEMDNKAQLFSPGMFARVRLAGSASATPCCCPTRRSRTDQGSKYVLVVADDGAVSRKTVRLGPLANGLRVVREGLGGGDWIVSRACSSRGPARRCRPSARPLACRSRRMPPARI